MDKQHIHAVSLADDIDKEILKTRILIDDLGYLHNKQLNKQLKENLGKIESDLNTLAAIFTDEFEKTNKNDLSEFENESRLMLSNFRALKSYINSNSGLNQSTEDSIINLHHQLSLSNHKFRRFLQRYLFDNTITYKKQVGTLFIVVLLFIFLSGYFVVYLIKQLSIAERIHIQKNIEIENRERQRIAADLHDGLGAYLSSIIMSIELMGRQFSTNDDLVNKIKHLNQLSRHALHSVEEVINNLNPALLARIGLFKALEKTINRINALSKTQFSIDSMGMNIKLSQSIEIMLYRICMELINNALKHSKAKEAKFTFNNTKNKVYIVYEDNGVGFNKDDISLQKENNKTGLYNLANRVESVGGSYSIDSELNKGVKIALAFKV